MSTRSISASAFSGSTFSSLTCTTVSIVDWLCCKVCWLLFLFFLMRNPFA